MSGLPVTPGCSKHYVQVYSVLQQLISTDHNIILLYTL